MHDFKFIVNEHLFEENIDFTIHKQDTRKSRGRLLAEQ